jgi:hypothetical protein
MMMPVISPSPSPQDTLGELAAWHLLWAALSFATPQMTEYAPPEHDTEPIHEPRLWRDNGWTVRVIKNNDDDGWAVEMILQGQAEPALVGPWTMGRDKKNPKPLDTSAFNTLVKTASEVLRRHEQHLHAQLCKQVVLGYGSEQVTVTFDIVPDEDGPHAILAATDAAGDALGEQRVRPDFKLSNASAEAWMEGGFKRLG